MFFKQSSSVWILVISAYSFLQTCQAWCSVFCVVVTESVLGAIIVCELLRAFLNRICYPEKFDIKWKEATACWNRVRAVFETTRLSQAPPKQSGQPGGLAQDVQGRPSAAVHTRQRDRHNGSPPRRRNSGSFSFRSSRSTNTIPASDIGSAESPAPAPKSFATETARTAWTNVFATPFVPSRPQPPAQGSNGVDKSGNSAATTSQALTPGLAKDEGSKLSDKAAVFHPAAKSPTQHSSSASPRIAAAREGAYNNPAGDVLNPTGSPHAPRHFSNTPAHHSATFTHSSTTPIHPSTTPTPPPNGMAPSSAPATQPTTVELLNTIFSSKASNGSSMSNIKTSNGGIPNSSATSGGSSGRQQTCEKGGTVKAKGAAKGKAPPHNAFNQASSPPYPATPVMAHGHQHSAMPWGMYTQAPPTYPSHSMPFAYPIPATFGVHGLPPPPYGPSPANTHPRPAALTTPVAQPPVPAGPPPSLRGQTPLVRPAPVNRFAMHPYSPQAMIGHGMGFAPAWGPGFAHGMMYPNSPAAAVGAASRPQMYSHAGRRQ